jgi:hypothetical protein
VIQPANRVFQARDKPAGDVTLPYVRQRRATPTNGDPNQGNARSRPSCSANRFVVLLETHFYLREL